MDIICSSRGRRWQSEGFKNVYSTIIQYWNKNRERSETMKMDYGDFKLAQERCNIEYGQSPGWGGFDLVKATIVSATYLGTKKVHEETLVEMNGKRGGACR